MTFFITEMNLKFSDNDQKTIESKINNDTIEMFKKYLTPENKIKLNRYNLVITGTVGSGKSTICESLAYIFRICDLKTNNFPEFLFIDDALSKSVLKKKINEEISTSTFQSYILDNWEKILNENQEKSGLNLFERCVDDSVICFCNIANKNDDLTEIQLLSLFERLKNINKKYSMPSYFDKNVHFTEIQSSDLNFNLTQILDIIKSDMKTNITMRIIGLSVSDYDSKARIQSRARDGEDGYSMDIIRTFNSHYKKLFKHLGKHKSFNRFVDMGKLL